MLGFMDAIGTIFEHYYRDTLEISHVREGLIEAIIMN